MKLGFTGTRHGMTEAQIKSLHELVDMLLAGDPSPVEAHHGDCVGADVQFHEILHRYNPKYVIHPPTEDRYRARCADAESLPPKHYHARNRDIVACSDVLIAAPAQTGEQRYGGTWYTVQQARQAGKPVRIIYPDGSIVEEQGRLLARENVGAA